MGKNIKNWPILKAPPVQEAILDIRFNLNSSSDVINYEKFSEAIKLKFPNKKERVQFQFIGEINSEKIKNQEQPNIHNSITKNGIILNSSDKKTIIQVSSTQISFHIIEPYREWPALLNEGKEIWNEYLKVLPPLFNIERIGLRYVNKIEIPVNEDFNLYFNLLPNIPEGIPHKLDGFFMQLNIPNEKGDINAIVNQTFEKMGESSLRFLLDIDAIKIVNYTNNQPSIWDDISDLREFKNEIFFKSLTEKTIKRYEN